MTNEEAIEILQSGAGVWPITGRANNAINTVIKALSQQTEDAISRAEVHNLLATWISDYLTDETREALETIDYKIEDLPSVTPKAEPCEDAISREQAKAEIRKAFPDLMDRIDINSILNELPSVTSKQRTGHWKREWYIDRFEEVCSECGRGEENQTDYCPNCGAKMEE